MSDGIPRAALEWADRLVDECPRLIQPERWVHHAVALAESVRDLQATVIRLNASRIRVHAECNAAESHVLRLKLELAELKTTYAAECANRYRAHNKATEALDELLNATWPDASVTPSRTPSADPARSPATPQAQVTPPRPLSGGASE